MASLHHGQRIAKLLAPVCELRNDVRMRLPVPLPVRKVRVLDRERRQGRRLPGGEGVIESGELLDEHAERPAVADDLVHGDQQEVLLLGQAHQAGPKQRARARGRRNEAALLE